LPNQNTLFLQSVVSGARYYLLGFVGEDENSAKKYFNSLQFNDFKYQEEFKEQKDTTLLYTVKSPVETQKGSKYDYYDRYNEVDDTDTLIDEAQKKVSKLLKQYKSWDKTSFYYTTTGEMIEVNAHKFNYYKSYKDVNEFLKNLNRLDLLYDWIKEGKINKEQFADLLLLHKEENQRQIDLDTWD
jgi:hypothetical protein